MILVDSSVWIDHLHTSEDNLRRALEQDAVGIHPLVVEELALGSLRQRGAFLGALRRLRAFPSAAHTEVLALVELHRLWGRGLSSVDVHLLAATLIFPGAQLWTRDKSLGRAAMSIGVPQVSWQ